MKLSEFKAKVVPGLYSYDHFEADNGAFIQMSVHRDHFVFQAENGERHEFVTLAALKQHVES